MVRFVLLFKTGILQIWATRMALVGHVGEYVDSKEDITSYIERVELYFAANYVKTDYKVATFIAFIGADAYGVSRNLLSPKRPKDKSFVQ